jgi:hypothetical protein
MESHADADATYAATRQVVADGKYTVVEQTDAERKIKVRSHVDEDSTSTQSFITIQTTADGKVTFTPSGYLVKPDGRIHRKLNSEIDGFNREIADKLKPATAVASASPSTDVGTSPQSASSVASAWNEPAYDPKIWGPGDFTCLPVKIPTDDQQTLKLKLSNGQEADLVLSLAYAPELCRSPAQCPLPTGCPALGFGDSQQVTKLAQLLVDKTIGDQATVLHRGQPVVTINLPSHGLIAKAMTQLKPTKPVTAKPAPSGGSLH